MAPYVSTRPSPSSTDAEPLGRGSAAPAHDHAYGEGHRVEDGREDRDQEHRPSDVADPRDAARLVLRVGAVFADGRQRKETNDCNYETDVDELGPLEDSLHDFPHMSTRLNVRQTLSEDRSVSSVCSGFSAAPALQQPCRAC